MEGLQITFMTLIENTDTRKEKYKYAVGIYMNYANEIMILRERVGRREKVKQAKSSPPTARSI